MALPLTAPLDAVIVVVKAAALPTSTEAVMGETVMVVNTGVGAVLAYGSPMSG